MNSGSYTHLERRGTGLPDNGLSFSLGDARDRSPSVGIGAVGGIKVSCFMFHGVDVLCYVYAEVGWVLYILGWFWWFYAGIGA